MTPTKGIVVDGSTSGNPGPSEYRAICLETRVVLFHHKIGIATNNIAEFIGLAHCVLYCIEKNIETEIFSDSQTALSWLKKKSANTSLAISPKTEKARNYLKRVLKKLENVDIEYDGIDLLIGNITVSKWYSSEYGEIPADFGRK